MSKKYEIYLYGNCKEVNVFERILKKEHRNFEPTGYDNYVVLDNVYSEKYGKGILIESSKTVDNIFKIDDLPDVIIGQDNQERGVKIFIEGIYGDIGMFLTQYLFDEDDYSDLAREILEEEEEFRLVINKYITQRKLESEVLNIQHLKMIENILDIIMSEKTDFYWSKYLLNYFNYKNGLPNKNIIFSDEKTLRSTFKQRGKFNIDLGNLLESLEINVVYKDHAKRNHLKLRKED